MKRLHVNQTGQTVALLLDSWGVKDRAGWVYG